MHKKWTVKRISIIPAIRTAIIVSFTVGLVISTVWTAFIALFSSALMSSFGQAMPSAAPFMLVILPLFTSTACAFSGALLTFLAVLSYNIGAALFGGIELELDQETQQEPDYYSRSFENRLY